MKNYRNYSSWPLNKYTNDGINQILYPLYSNVNRKVQEAQIFPNVSNFADDCRYGCGDDMVSKLSASGSEKISAKDYFNLGVKSLGIWSDDKRSKAEQEAAQKAAEITRLQIAKQQAETQTAAVQAEKAKITITIVAISGAVILAGFAAYYLFAKKKA